MNKYSTNKFWKEAATLEDLRKLIEKHGPDVSAFTLEPIEKKEPREYTEEEEKAFKKKQEEADRIMRLQEWPGRS